MSSEVEAQHGDTEAGGTDTGCSWRVRRAAHALGVGGVLLALVALGGTAVLYAVCQGGAGTLPALVLSDAERVAVTEEAGGLSLGTGARCPAFSLPSCAGDSVSLADFVGRRVAVVFARPGCPACERLGQLLAGRVSLAGHHVLLISGGDRGEVEAFRTKHDLVAPVLLDQQGTTARLYGAESVPTAYLVDEAGMLRGAARGTRCWALARDHAP